MMFLKPRSAWHLLIFAALGVAAAFLYPAFCAAFGPMKRHESQCLICSRERLTQWNCGKKVEDVVSSNKYSNWVDTFVPLTHGHVWRVHTNYVRSHWFGSTSIGCGGVAVIARIFEQRNAVGEQGAQQLHLEWRKMVEAPTFDPMNLKAMDAFEKSVTENPASLLKGE